MPRHAIAVALFLVASALPAMAQGDAVPPPSPAAPRDVVAYHPALATTPEGVLEELARVDWWVEHSVADLTPEGAEEELYELQFDLLENWIADLDLSGYPHEPRDPAFSPPISATERTFLFWDLAVRDHEGWRATRDLALDDLRLMRPEAIVGRYRTFCITDDCRATPAQVLLFARALAAERVRAGGEAWIAALLGEYSAHAAALLADYPAFSAMNSASGRTATLEVLYEGRPVAEHVVPMRGILEVLTLLGPEAVAQFVALVEGPDGFVAYPEQLALRGGGAVYPVLQRILREPALAVAKRQAILALAIEHATRPIGDPLALAQGVLTGEGSLYPYSPEQRAELTGEVRTFLLEPATWEALDLTRDAVVFGETGDPAVPDGLADLATLLLSFESPMEEALTLLDRGEAKATAVGLAALADALSNPSEMEPSDWAYLEPICLEAARQAVEAHGEDPLIAGLALLILVRLAPNPSVLPPDGGPLAGWPLRLAAMYPLGPEMLVLKSLALTWHERGVAITTLEPLGFAVVLGSDGVDFTTLGLQPALELLRFDRAAAAAGYPVLGVRARHTLALTALDRMDLFAAYDDLLLVVEVLGEPRGRLPFPPEAIAALSRARERLMALDPPPTAALIDGIDALLALSPSE